MPSCNGSSGSTSAAPANASTSSWLIVTRGKSDGVCPATSVTASSRRTVVQCPARAVTAASVMIPAGQDSVAVKTPSTSSALISRGIAGLAGSTPSRSGPDGLHGPVSPAANRPR